jgi:protein involved in polysaccharide export with SLBB domain
LDIVRYIILVLALIALLAPPAVDAQAADGGAIVLRPGDVVRVTVWRNPELTGEFAIARDGTLAHPLYRDVVVGGLDVATVESRLRDLLSQLETNPRFVMEPLLRVSVGGEVRQPSLYTLPPETSIAEAVALAGGATERGRMDRIRLFRDGREHRVDLTAPVGGLAQAPVRSGDQIFVQRRVSIFREYIAPAGSITAALVSLISIAIRN